MKTSSKTKLAELKHLKVGQKYYVVFRMIPSGELERETSLWYMPILEVGKEKWKDDEEEQLVPDFECICNTLAAVAAIVRTDPSAKYAVIAGTFSTIEPHVQVFMGGVNMNTLQAEGWDGE